jgi:hypothetical protein
MSFGLRLVSGAVLSMAIAVSPVAARGWHGGHGGYYGHGHGGYYGHRGGGIGAFGGFVLGAAVIGGVAAIASANSRDGERDYQRSYNGAYDAPGYQGDYGYSEPSAYDSANDEYEQAREGNYDDRGDARSAGGDPVTDCSRAAERRAQVDGGYARVLRIDKVTDVEGGAAVRGTLEVNRGREAPVARMAFTCTASHGDIRQLRLG